VSERDGYAALREDIVAGELGPGERLVEADLCKRLGLGRSGVRTALVRLEQEGLVVRELNRGAKVKVVSLDEAVEILEARARLEGLAARGTALNASEEDVRGLRSILAEMRRLLDEGDFLAVSEANARLHRRLLEISRHSTAIRLCSTLASQTVRHQFRTILAPGRPERSFAEHSAIVDAVAAGDADAAEEAMHRHLAGVARALHARAAQKEAA